MLPPEHLSWFLMRAPMFVRLVDVAVSRGHGGADELMWIHVTNLDCRPKDENKPNG